MPITEKIALFDLDGTLAGYDPAMASQLAMLGMSLPVDRNDATAEQDYARRLIHRQPGFWRDLPEHQPGFDILELALRIGFSPMVLTQGPMATTSAWSEKVEWCTQHVPDVPLTITRNKSLVYGRVLVDDWPKYFIPWLRVRPRGIVICPAHPWNAKDAIRFESEPYADRIIRYNGDNLGAVNQALLNAFAR